MSVDFCRQDSSFVKPCLQVQQGGKVAENIYRIICFSSSVYCNCSRAITCSQDEKLLIVDDLLNEILVKV